MLLPFINPRLPSYASHAAIVISRMVQTVARTDEPTYHVTLGAAGDEQVRSASLSRLFDCLPKSNEAHAGNCND
jgi:hypothetical protein